MARTHALIAALFIILVVLATPAAAETPEQPPAETTQEQEAWRGDVPITWVIGGTGGALGLLSVVAVRRKWV